MQQELAFKHLDALYQSRQFGTPETLALIAQVQQAVPDSPQAVALPEYALLRRTALGLASQPAPLAQFAYDPDSGRLQTVTSGEDSATYSYLANSPLVENITFQHDGTTRMTTTKRYDALNRLTSITNAPSAAAPVGFRYVYNTANQRTTVTNADASRWVYQYDQLGQVISGKKYWSDGTPVAGQQFEYRFDDIGNRRTNGFGGNAAGLSLRESRYAVNDLNQYTSRTIPGFVNVLGEATNTASVSVNTNLAYRKDRYFRAELSVDNTAGPVWLGITNLAVLPVGGGNYVVSNLTGNVLWPKTPETFTYDADGNLTSDSLWTNQWNAENRRTVIESRTAVPVAARRREQWTHLPDGRWIERIVSTNNGTAYYPAFTNRYVWDGQVLLAVLDGANNLVLSFLRGLDLSGSQAGAGGVGGVLFIGHFGSAISHHAVAYDGNGNVAALVNATDGTETARYEYGPFGEPLRMTGPMAKANPIRFSTQFADDVTGDVKFLFRDYDSSTGRWLSRDPIGERGGGNIYAFVGNNPMKYIDPDGRAPKNVNCGGVCGAIIDDWVLDEIKAQTAGWDKWKKDNPSKDKIGDYITWANGNQRYKDPDFFKFNTGTSCGTKDKGAEVGCGFSVTLCGKCVRSAILGNIMYGLVGNYAGFTDQELKTASDWKRRVGMDVDQYDEDAYKLGADVNGATDFCSKFNELLQKTPSALYEGRKGGGYNDLSTCRPCTEKTSEKRHGGNEKPRLRP